MEERSALDVMEVRWASRVLLMLVEERRFNYLLANIEGISDRMLTVRLRELEDQGLIVRTVAVQSPVAVSYSLTERGRSMISPLGELAAL